MKPGNLSERMMVPNPAATKDEDSIQHTSNASMCAFLMFEVLRKESEFYGKKTVYLRMCDQRPPR